MNNAPKLPPIIPKIMAAGMSARSEGSVELPSLIRPAFWIIISPPACIYLKILRKNVLILQAKKTLQVNEKDQNVLGLDNSYANKDPPIGAPKAALTPEARPIAINFLRS